MNTKEVSFGKLKGFQRIASSDGVFRMLAIDQRSSLKKMIKDTSGSEPLFEDIALVKRLIVSTLSSYASATLLDPEYAMPVSVKYLARESGLITSLEASTYDKAGENGKERRAVLLDGWNVSKAKKAGSDAVKLLIHYRSDVSEETREHQQTIVRKVGEQCRDNDILFILEPLTYPLLEDESSTDTPEFAGRKLKLIIDTVLEFSKEEYKVDILKLEFPVNMKYVRGFNYGYFDGKERQALFSVKDAEDACYEITRNSRVPWVVLSAGVDFLEFEHNVEIAARSGASGFLGGRAIWKEAIRYFPSQTGMLDYLSTSGVNNMLRLFEASKKSTPFYEHHKLKSFANLQCENSGEEWFKKY